MAAQRDEFPLALDLQAQDTEAVIGIVKRDPLNQSSEMVKFGLGRSIGWGGTFFASSKYEPVITRFW